MFMGKEGSRVGSKYRQLYLSPKPKVLSSKHLSIIFFKKQQIYRWTIFDTLIGFRKQKVSFVSPIISCNLDRDICSK